MSDSAVHQFRRKVTLASMAAVFVSIAALIVTINYVNYTQTFARLREAMDEIASSTEGERGEGGRTMEGQKKRQEEQQEGQQEDMGFERHGGRQSANAQYGSRFFFVIVDEEGNSTVLAKGNTELLEEDAPTFAERVIALGNTEGVLDDYLYSVDQVDAGTRILFLDCTTDLQSLGRLLGISVAVGVAAFLIASVFVVRFAGFAVRPLEESAQKQKRFVADAGHELKTPLSVIATNMDILEVDLEDQPDELEWIDSTNRQVSNMRDLVNDLISLSKMEEGEADLIFTDVALSDLAHECVMTFDQVARSQGKELIPTIGEDLRTKGDEPSIRQLMTILIDNAVKYAAGDGSVFVELGSAGRSVVFQTRNDWHHDVDPKELDSLFDRFVRGDQSRDRSGGSSGYGLGLSIARVIAQKNNVRLAVHEDERGRIVFRATFAAR